MTDQIIQERNSKFGSNLNLNYIFKNDINKLNLRKKTIDNILEQKRIKFYVLQEENKLKTSNSKKNTINLFLLNINNELKYPPVISKLINQKDSSEIFKFLNEINNTNEINDNIKYGLYLLNSKISNDSEENIDLDNLLNNNFAFIINKMLFLIKNDEKNYENNKTILSTIIQILINFSYYSNENQTIFLINNNFLDYYIYFLKICNEDNLIEDIFYLISNLCAINFNISSIIFNYNNNILLDIINDYCMSSFKSQKPNLLHKILSIYFNYLDSITEDENNEINISFKIIESIYNILINLIDFKNCFSKCLWGIYNIYKILFQKNFIKNFIENVLSSESDSFYTCLFSYNYCYNNNFHNIIPFTNIIKNIFYLYNNNKKDYKSVCILEKKINNLNYDNNIIDFYYMLLQNPLKKEIKIALLDTLYEISLNNCYNLFENSANDILGYFVNNISNHDFKIKKISLRILNILSSKSQLKLCSSIFSKGIINQIVVCLDPINSCLNDNELVLLCLSILENLFIIGNFIKNISNHNNFTENFEFLGGKELLEKLLGNPSKEVYLKSETILDKFFNEKNN